MTLALRSRPRVLVLAVVLVLVGGAFTALASPAQAQEIPVVPVSKDCPSAVDDPYTIGDTVTCNFTVQNFGFLAAEVIQLTEQSEADPTPVDITCTLDDGTVIAEGDDLPPNEQCSGSFTVTIPDDPTFCNSLFEDRVTLELLYHQFGVPLTVGAFARHVSVVVCPPEITVTKTVSELSKVGDDVTYMIEVCNVGSVAATRDSVDDTLLGDISDSFSDTLAPDTCEDVELTRTVLATDPDPLVNTVTATYSVDSFQPPLTDTATATATTNLFESGVEVAKSCAPDPVAVGAVLTCTIVVTNTSSDDAPDLVGGTIIDTRTGDLLEPANPAVASSTCAAVLPTGEECTIVTTRTVLESDPVPLENVVIVRYNPDGFPNDITDSATARVSVERPGGEGCGPGFWKQEQHFDSWFGFQPDDSFEDVFGVDVTLRTGGQGTIEDPTLLEALRATGGGVNALARHAVAALLDAPNPDVASDLTTADVIALVQGAFESGDFETAKNLLANEQDCPLN